MYHVYIYLVFDAHVYAKEKPWTGTVSVIDHTPAIGYDLISCVEE